MTDSVQLSDVLARLDHRPSGRGYRARCPAHGGENPTALSISEGEAGHVLLHCHAHGCTYEDILRALGLWSEGTTAPHHTNGVRKPPKRAKLTDDEKLIMACAGREAMGLLVGPLPNAPIDPELIAPYGGFLETLWDAYAQTSTHDGVQATYVALRPALAHAMPKFLHALDKRLKDYSGQPLPPLHDDSLAEGGPRFQPYSMAELQREELPERHWIIEEVIPEGVHLVAGPVGVGKSYWALQLCLGVAHGGKVFSKFEVEQGEALYLSLEDDKLGMRERMGILVDDGAAWPKDLYVQHEARRLDMGLVEDLEGWLTEHPRTRVIVIDVLFNVRAPYQSKADLYAQDYAVANALKPLAYKHHVAIILLHHCNKQVSPDDPLHAVSGSTGLLAPADVKAVFMRAKGEADIKLYLRGRPIREQWLAFGYRECVWTYLGEAQAVERHQTRKAILEALAKVDGPMTPKAIAEKSGMRGDLVRFTLRKMTGSGEVKQITRGYYTLPPSPPHEREQETPSKITHSQHSQETLSSQHTPGSHTDPPVVSAPLAAVSGVVSAHKDDSQPKLLIFQQKSAIVSGVSGVNKDSHLPIEVCVCGNPIHPRHRVCFVCQHPRVSGEPPSERLF